MSRLVSWLSAIAVLSVLLSAQQNPPLVKSLDKSEAVRGESVTVTGERLTKDNVAGIYLTNGKDDIAQTITEQTATTLRFTVGKDVPLGRYGILILTGGQDAMYIEQPIKLTIVDKPTAPTETSSAANVKPQGPTP